MRVIGRRWLEFGGRGEVGRAGVLGSSSAFGVDVRAVGTALMEL